MHAYEMTRKHSPFTNFLMDHFIDLHTISDFVRMTLKKEYRMSTLWNHVNNFRRVYPKTQTKVGDELSQHYNLSKHEHHEEWKLCQTWLGLKDENTPNVRTCRVLMYWEHSTVFSASTIL